MKCIGKIHVFTEEYRKCLCGRRDKWWFNCPRCKVGSVSKHAWLPCEDCLKDPEYRKEVRVALKKTLDRSGIKHYREPTAFGYDRATGRPWALDRFGKKFDPSETRYDLKRDPHGWKSTGKIPKKKKIYI